MIFLLLFATIPTDIVVSEQVDVAEINHFYDDKGRHVFDQVIFYDWIGFTHMVRDWRLIKSESQRPVNGKMLFYDQETLRKITASSQRETWTQHDPELAERERLPKERRRLLYVKPVCDRKR
jgi:hypothetical protein